jgi:hypothetical protein
MQQHRIDFAKLLGFDAVSDELAGSVDFRAAMIDAKLGAKVGAEELVALDVPKAALTNR